MNDAINKAIEVMDIARKIAVDGSPYQAMLAEAIEALKAEQARQDCYVSVPIDAVNWLKEKFPQLCIKAGLCVKVGRRLYTITIVKKG